jgi:hypothetical protein
MDPTTITRNLVNSRKANAMAKIWRTYPKVKGKAKAKAKASHLHDINVVVQTILLEMVELYQKFLKESNNNKRSYEAHFNNMTKKATTSGTMLSNLKMPKLMDNDDMDMESMIMEYNSNDVFGDLKWVRLSLG